MPRCPVLTEIRKPSTSASESSSFRFRIQRESTLLCWELTTYPYATSLDARQWQTLLSLGTSTVALRMSTWTTDSHSSLNGAGLKVMMALDFGT